MPWQGLLHERTLATETGMTTLDTNSLPSCCDVQPHDDGWTVSVNRCQVRVTEDGRAMAQPAQVAVQLSDDEPHFTTLIRALEAGQGWQPFEMQR